MNYSIPQSTAWIPVQSRLPRHHQAVLIRRSEDNWRMDHLLANDLAGDPEKVWRWQACIFLAGRKSEDVNGLIHAEDQNGNNLRPYCWDQFGPEYLFGQDVSHWIPIYGIDHP